MRPARLVLAGFSAGAVLMTGMATGEAQVLTVVAAQACNPHYAGTCIPRGVFDADCAGRGDGPFFVQETSFHVIGSDEFDLDPDHDGLGCEGSAELAVGRGMTSTTRAAGPTTSAGTAATPLPITGSRTGGEVGVAALLVLWGVALVIAGNTRRKLRMD